MLARTKGIGAGGFRARPADGALAATGGASPSPRWDGLLGRIGGRRAPRPSIKVRQQLPGRARYVVVVGRQEPAVRARAPGSTLSQGHPCTWRLPQAGHHTVTTRSPRRVTPTATTSATRSRAQRGQAQTAAAGPPPSGAGRTCQRRASLSVCSVSAQQSRLVGAVLAEQHDEWAESRRRLDVDVLGKSRNDQHPPSEQEAHPAALDRLNHPHRRITRQRRHTTPLDLTRHD